MKQWGLIKQLGQSLSWMAQTTATWDLRETPSYSLLIEGYYTLHVQDQRGQDTSPRPGWLLPDSQMKIAL